MGLVVLRLRIASGDTWTNVAQMNAGRGSELSEITGMGKCLYVRSLLREPTVLVSF